MIHSFRGLSPPLVSSPESSFLLLFYLHIWEGRMSKPRGKSRGFTLVELLVVIAIIGVLVALLLPAVQAAREAARRMSCSNNMKNLALAVHNYADANKQFPIGSRASGSNAYGQSWTIGLLPYIEQDALYAQWQANGNGQGWSNPANQTLINGASGTQALVLNIYRCPSSPLPKLVGTNSMNCSYVGIAGAVSSGSAINWSTSQASPNNTFSETRVATGSGSQSGIVSAGGCFFPEGSASFGDLTRDGTSNQIFFGEQSDFLRKNTSGTITQVAGGSSYPNGCFAGSSNPVIPSSAAGWSGACHGITTVRAKINHKEHNPANGIDETGGLNCGIYSAHGGGSMIGIGDGSVKFMSENLDMVMLFRMCTRDDGGVVQMP